MASAQDAPNAVALYLAYVLASRLRVLFPPGSRVIDLGVDTGPVTAHLEAGGVVVQRADRARPANDGAYEGAFFTDTDRAVSADRRLLGPLADSLRPGAPVVLRLPRRRTGRGQREVREALGPGFAWRGTFALGLLVPSPLNSAWAERYPGPFGLLAAAEGMVRHWPLLRGRGRAVVLEAVRR
jgi:hypothetical protein